MSTTPKPLDPVAFDLAARLAARVPTEELRALVEGVEAGQHVTLAASRRTSPRGSVPFRTVDEVLAAVEARLITRDQGTQLLAVPPRRRPLAAPPPCPHAAGASLARKERGEPGTQETRGRTRRDEHPLGSYGFFLSGIPFPTKSFRYSGGVSI